MGSEEGSESTEGFEVAEEVKPPEPLGLSSHQLQLHALATELSAFELSAFDAQVCRSPVDGMYVIPSEKSPLKWFAVLFLRRGVYQGAIFRFHLFIPSDFPDTSSIPVVRFACDIFHPLIKQKTNELDMSRFFPDGWKKEKHHIVNVLLVIQRVFFSLDLEAETCANYSAALLWNEEKRRFRELARRCVDHSRSVVYDDPDDADDANCIRFTPWCASEHESTRSAMLTGAVSPASFSSPSNGKPSGFSWLDPDALTYMTTAIPVSSPSHYKISETSKEDAMEKLDLSSIHLEEDENVVEGSIMPEGTGVVSELP